MHIAATGMGLIVFSRRMFLAEAPPYHHVMRRTASVGISLLLATSLLQAQVVAPGSWEKVNALPPGNQIIITLKSGVRMEGAFQDSSRQDLALTAPTGGEQRVLKADIQGVIGEKKDSVVDGLLLGAAIGAGAGVVVGYDRRTFECRAGCSIQIGVTLFTPIGALVGWLRDRKQNQTEVLYQAP
jgi:hypothetical protein